MRYFEVEAKCGHVGKLNCVWVKFAVKAKTGKEAATIARRFGRVKHDHKDAIRYVKEITKEEYDIILKTNKEDEYLNCKSRHEQNQIDISDRLEVDDYNVKKQFKRKTRNAEFKIKKNMIREKSWKKMLKEFNEDLIAII